MFACWGGTEAESMLQEPIIEITTCEREILMKGVTLWFLPVQIPAAENQEDRGRGWQSRILSGLPIGLLVEAEREQVPGLLTLSTGEERERGSEHFLTLIGPSISSAAALIGALIRQARLSLLLQSFLSSLVVTPYSQRKGCLSFCFFFLFNRYAGFAYSSCVSTK